MLPSHYWKSSQEIHVLTSQYFIGLPLLFIISLHLLGMEATRLVRISGESDSQPSCRHYNRSFLFLHCLFFNFLSRIAQRFWLGSNLDFEKATEELECYMYCGSSFELPWQYFSLSCWKIKFYGSGNSLEILGTMWCIRICLYCLWFMFLQSGVNLRHHWQ